MKAGWFQPAHAIGTRLKPGWLPGVLSVENSIPTARIGTDSLSLARRVLLHQIQEVDLFTESGNLPRKYPTAIITHRAAKTA
jgi:hypothetical protein